MRPNHNIQVCDAYKHTVASLMHKPDTPSAHHVITLNKRAFGRVGPLGFLRGPEWREEKIKNLSNLN